MNILTAYEIVFSTSTWQADSSAHQAPFSDEEISTAKTIIFQELMTHKGLLARRFPSLNSGEYSVDDIIHDFYFTLIRRMRQLSNSTDDAVRSLLRTGLLNQAHDYFRAQNRRNRHFVDVDQPKNIESSTEYINPAELISQRESLENSAIILDEYASPESIEERSYLFLLEFVIAQALRPAYRQAARQAIQEMRQITNGTTTYDRLVELHLGNTASDDKERKRLRNTIQKRHSRTRDRLLNWLNGPALDLIKEPSSKKEAQLTEFDRQLLLRAVDNLRTRSPGQKS